MQISTHAVRRYQERVENVPTSEVCRRIRSIVAGKQVGPRIDIKMQGDVVMTIYPKNNNNVTRALVNGSWEAR